MVITSSPLTYNCFSIVRGDMRRGNKWVYLRVREGFVPCTIRGDGFVLRVSRTGNDVDRVPGPKEPLTD